MKLSTFRKPYFYAVFVVAAAAVALTGVASTAQNAHPAALPARNVIVILREQRADLPATHGLRAARIAALASAQSPVVAHLKAAGATNIRGFALINAVAAHVTQAEADALAAHPLVQAVVPDRTLRLTPRGGPSANWTGGGGSGSGGGIAGQGAVCGTLEPEALQLTNAAFNDLSRPQAQRVLDGNGKYVTGQGVKVAWIADGLDTTVPGFTHQDGTPVFIDYQNFNGDPAGTPTGGGEAFLDASSIAAQDQPNGKTLTYDISQYVNLAVASVPAPCRIRIRGMAPGASLVGLNVFSSIGTTTTSNFVQAIQYAVNVDDVDVINESFGGNPFPDNPNDPISLANHAAVAAGVTVVVSTGDAGTNGTLGSPSTDPWVISVGASTQLRVYAQSGYGVQHFATNGWLNNNISGLSSGGFSQSGPRTPDVVAPGDLGWALCSTDAAMYQDCVSLVGTTTPIQISGGTSESSPLTAGAAALVIQAYRSTHHGASPSPALVRNILMSTATDLGAPPSEQGAGLINAYAAVQAALSLADGNGKGAANGAGVVLNNPTSTSFTDNPGTPETFSFSVTNTSSTAQHLAPSLQALGAPIAGATRTVVLHPATDPVYYNQGGFPRAYRVVHFNVPQGAQHLDAAIAWQAPYYNPPVLAQFGLIDPNGRDAGYTLEQGSGSGYGHYDVNNPVPGQWTAIIFTSKASGTYAGPVQFSWAAERYTTFGSVSPASANVAPGATQWFTARFSMPSQAGDQGVAVRFAPGATPRAEIPIALRTLVPMGSIGGNFGGTLTGGNGRAGAGPTQTFAFDVPAGLNNMSLALTVPDSLYLLEGVLVDPNGMQVSVQPNVDVNGNSVNYMELDRANPQPGRWHFVLLQNFYTSGNQTSLPFTAQIGFNTAQVNRGGLPNSASATLSASAAPVVVPITVTNTTALTQAYFADARLAGLTAFAFGTSPACGTTTLPYACFGTFLPTQVHSVSFVAQSTAPIQMDASNSVGYIVGFTGAPDLWAKPVGPDTVAASLTEPEIPWGAWYLFPSLIGPYGAAGASTTPVSTYATVALKPFDGAAVADSGDLWSDITFGTNTFNPLVLAPGASGTINVTITPDPSLVGTVVKGSIYIDTFNPTTQTGDEVVRLPYTYTVVK